MMIEISGDKWDLIDHDDMFFQMTLEHALPRKISQVHQDWTTGSKWANWRTPERPLLTQYGQYGI